MGALVAALGAHRKFAGLDHASIARDLAEALAGAQMSAPKQRPAKTAVQLAEDVAAAAFELPEGPNEETVRRKLRAFVVNGGWGPRGSTPARPPGGAYRGRSAREPSPQHTVTPEYLEREAKAQAARRAELEALDAAERARPPHERDPFGPDWEPPPEDSDA